MHAKFKRLEVNGGENGQIPLSKKKKIQHFAPFPKLIREMSLF